MQLLITSSAPVLTDLMLPELKVLQRQYKKDLENKCNIIIYN